MHRPTRFFWANLAPYPWRNIQGRVNMTLTVLPRAAQARPARRRRASRRCRWRRWARRRRSTTTPFSGGARRAPSHCRSAPPPIHFIPYSLTYSVPLFLKRQCDRTLGARGTTACRRTSITAGAASHGRWRHLCTTLYISVGAALRAKHRSMDWHVSINSHSYSYISVGIIYVK
jgi:hypothetical protein